MGPRLNFTISEVNECPSGVIKVLRGAYSLNMGPPVNQKETDRLRLSMAAKCGKINNVWLGDGIQKKNNVGHG